MASIRSHRPFPTLGSTALLICATVFSAPVHASGHPKDVKGTRIIRTITNSGETAAPQDLTSTPISAFVPDGMGGFMTISGTGLANGTFTIPQVPKDEYWFRFGNSYVWTDEHKLDLDIFAYGRPDAVPATLSTILTFNVTGLTPFAASDILQWYATNVNSVYGYLGDFNPTNMPLAGDIAMVGTAQDWVDTGLLLVDATKGDEPSLTQLSSVSSGAETYSVLTGIFKPASLVQLDGLPTTLNGALTPVPQHEDVRIAWDRTPYATYQAQVNPTATPSFQRFVVHTPPWGTNKGFIAATADLVNFYPSSLATTSLDLGEAHYGNPFPHRWGQVYSINQNYSVSYIAPGATHPRPIQATLSTNSLKEPKRHHPMLQAIGPVISPMINGSDAFVSQSGLTASPSIAWSRPTQGEADAYSVAVLRIFAQGVSTRTTTVASLITEETSLTVPPGILQPGQSYIFRIRAIKAKDAEPSKAPFRLNTFPFATADALTAMVTVAP
ncbi:MAG: hypothetical protein IPP78_11625 [Holophagaceae bacterium]|nr:hypothetical protein [Holophagaceae bacterium]